MFVAVRDLRFAKGRFALVSLVIVLVALLSTLLSGLANGLVDSGISGLRRLPLTHLAFQSGADATFSRSTLTPDNLKPWQDLPGVEASPVGMSFFNARRDDGSTIDIALFGVPADSFLAPEGPAREALSGPPGLILSDTFQAEGVKVGDELTVVGVDRTLPVVGFTYAGSYGHVDIAFTSLSTWQALLYGDNARDRFSAIALRASDTSGFAGIEAVTGTDVVSKTGAYKGSPGYVGETATMTLIRGFLLVISALIVGSFFTVWTVQRTGEIGLLKALGASTSYVVRDALGQITIVLLASTAVGAGIAVGLGQMVGADVPFRLESTQILGSVALLILLGLLGCLIAIRRITSVDPIVALRSRA